MIYTLSDFDYTLPKELIAQQPANPRDHSRLLVYDRKTGTITDDYFYNLYRYLPSASTLVVNNSKVEKSRLLFGGKEVFITDQHNNHTVDALVRPGKKFRLGDNVKLTSEITARVKDVLDDGRRRLLFNISLDDARFEAHRLTPFPPYIEQNEDLADRYQTIFARHQGSKAAPTAGLHFTDEVFKNLAEKGISRAEVTLHVGLGTFAPVKNEKLENSLHSELYEIDRQTAMQLNDTSHITAVGTTSARVLESNRLINNRFTPGKKSTDIYIKPGFEFKAVDALVTNFHLPKSTLLIMIASLMGYEQMRVVYRHAIAEKYRFYSFGDAMLIL
ncbi:MAG: tRNA preQ1(34) S-adenosylmethionine ribosyltransferase-isomerase QueA [Balneolales bacterium]